MLSTALGFWLTDLTSGAVSVKNTVLEGLPEGALRGGSVMSEC